MNPRTSIALLIISLALMGVNIALIVQNGRLKAANTSTKPAVTEKGYRFSDLHFRGLDGSEEKISLSNGASKSLLLVFSSTCPFCKKQYPYWKQLIGSIDRSDWQIFAISAETDRDKLRVHMDEQGIKDVKIGTVPIEELQSAHMIATPMTLAVSPDGEVMKVWSGLWTKEFELQF